MENKYLNYSEINNFIDFTFLEFVLKLEIGV